LPQKPGAEYPSIVSCLALSADGRTLAAGSWGGSLHLWEVATGKLLQSLPGVREWVRAVAFSPDGGLLASTAGRSDQSGEIILWDVAAGKELRRLQGHQKAVAQLAFAPDGKLLASAGEGG